MKHYRFVDYATQGYIALTAVLLLLFHNQTMPEWPWLLAAHVLALGGIHGLIRLHGRARPSGWLDFLRSFYPIVLYTGFYRETGALNKMFFSDYLDPVFIRADQYLFGWQPSIAFMEEAPWVWLSELLYLAYFSYYLMITGVGVALFLRNRRQFAHYVAVVSLIFYVCYTTYIFLPVMGPRAFFREIEGYRLPDDLQALAVSPTFPDQVRAGACYRLMAFIYHHFEAPGAAFPSSHVAIAIVTVSFSFRYLRPIRWLHAVDVLLLCTATVYCRYHYVVDVFAGALAALALLPIANHLYFRTEAGPQPPRPEGPGGPSAQPPERAGEAGPAAATQRPRS